MVEDLGSRNGTRVGGLTLMGARVLPPGERIVIGRTTLMVGATALAPRPVHPVPAACRRSRALVERDLDAELDDTSAGFLRDHLAGCPDCRARHDMAGTWRGVLRDSLIEAPPEGLAERVGRALRSEPGT